MKSKAPLLSLFFSTLKSPPKTTRKRPTHTIFPSCVSYQTPPLPTTPSFCSFLCRPNERRPSKSGALPISDDCRWWRQKSADNGGGGNVDSGAIDGRRRGRRRTTAAEDSGGGGFMDVVRTYGCHFHEFPCMQHKLCSLCVRLQEFNSRGITTWAEGKKDEKHSLQRCVLQ
jgi:hypothetical protein